MEDNKEPAHGEFCWMELHSKNVEACKSFYAQLFGWDYQTKGVGGNLEYHEFGATGKKRAGGMFQMGAEFGDMPSHWMAYVAVADVDAAAEKVKTLGGAVCVPPHDIPDTGRFCVINDPSGAMVSLVTLKD